MLAARTMLKAFMKYFTNHSQYPHSTAIFRCYNKLKFKNRAFYFDVLSFHIITNQTSTNALRIFAGRWCF